MYQHLTYRKIHLLLALLFLPLMLVATLNPTKTFAGIQVQSRSDQLSDSTGGAAATHVIGFSFTNTSTPVGSIKILFCDNGPIIGTLCNLPVGMNLAGAVYSNEVGNTGFTLSSTNNGALLLSRNPGVPSGVQNYYTFKNIINPAFPGEYWGRITTYSSNDGTGPYIEQGGVAFDITSKFTITSIVPPYLTFCSASSIINLNCGSAVGDEINFGNLSNTATSDATSQFVVGTNAQNGYNVTIHGVTMASGNYVIPNLKSPTPSKLGTSQFGINLVSNNSPRVGQDKAGIGLATGASPSYGIPNYFAYNDGDIIAGTNSASGYNEFTTSYLVNVDTNQPQGVYATTLYYICLANF